MYFLYSKKLIELIISESSEAKDSKCHLQKLFIDLCNTNCHHKYIIKLVKDHGVDSGVENDQELVYACVKGYIEIVKILLSFDQVNPVVNDN